MCGCIIIGTYKMQHAFKLSLYHSLFTVTYKYCHTGAGIYSIRLEVGQCLGYPIGDLATGFFSTSRFLVEELPMPTTTQISYSSGGGFLPTEPSALVVPDPEVYHPIWHHCTVPNVDNPKDSGSIDETKCSFVKIEDNTDIMVSWDGNLGVESCR